MWDSEATQKARVHVVIVGFSRRGASSAYPPKVIYNVGANGEAEAREAGNINAYLLDAPDVFIRNRSRAVNPGLPPMSKGSQPTDGGNLILTAAERDELVDRYPAVERFIRQYMGAEEFINGRRRYCLWMVDAEPNEYRKIAPIMERLKRVAEFRQASPTAAVRRAAESPPLFTQIRQPKTDYLVVPEVSSERREYIPIGFNAANVVASNKLYLVASDSLSLFALLCSSAHNAWMRVVGGRLEMSYSYTPSVFYNFPQFEHSDAVDTRLSSTASGILAARKSHPHASLADLYDPLTMPPGLRAAHRANDCAVLAAYGWEEDLPEEEIVARLMERYRQLTMNN